MLQSKKKSLKGVHFSFHPELTPKLLLEILIKTDRPLEYPFEFGEMLFSQVDELYDYLCQMEQSDIENILLRCLSDGDLDEIWGKRLCIPRLVFIGHLLHNNWEVEHL